MTHPAAPTTEEMRIVGHDRFWDFVNVHKLRRVDIINGTHRGYMFLNSDNTCFADMAWLRSDPSDVPMYRIRKDVRHG